MLDNILLHLPVAHRRPWPAAARWRTNSHGVRRGGGEPAQGATTFGKLVRWASARRLGPGGAEEAGARRDDTGGVAAQARTRCDGGGQGREGGDGARFSFHGLWWALIGFVGGYISICERYTRAACPQLAPTSLPAGRVCICLRHLCAFSTKVASPLHMPLDLLYRETEGHFTIR
jgi:hypothetical protein